MFFYYIIHDGDIIIVSFFVLILAFGILYGNVTLYMIDLFKKHGIKYKWRARIKNMKNFKKIIEIVDGIHKPKVQKIYKLRLILDIIFISFVILILLGFFILIFIGLTR